MDMPSSLDAKDEDPFLSPAFRISSLIMANISIEVLRRTLRGGGGTDTVELSSDWVGITVGPIGTAGPGMGAGSGPCASATVAGPLGCGGGGDRVGAVLAATGGAGGGSETLEEAEDDGPL